MAVGQVGEGLPYRAFRRDGIEEIKAVGVVDIGARVRQRVGHGDGQVVGVIGVAPGSAHLVGTLGEALCGGVLVAFGGSPDIATGVNGSPTGTANGHRHIATGAVRRIGDVLGDQPVGPFILAGSALGVLKGDPVGVGGRPEVGRCAVGDQQAGQSADLSFVDACQIAIGIGVGVGIAAHVHHIGQKPAGAVDERGRPQGAGLRVDR